MSNTILIAMEIAGMLSILTAYYYVATHPNNGKAMKYTEVGFVYALFFFFHFTKRLPIIFLALCLLSIFIFKKLTTIDDGEGNKGLSY
jgi:hypothetical protein